MSTPAFPRSCHPGLSSSNYTESLLLWDHQNCCAEHAQKLQDYTGDAVTAENFLAVLRGEEVCPVHAC